jgi:sugar phosphate isomerase/epimerase
MKIGAMQHVIQHTGEAELFRRAATMKLALELNVPLDDPAAAAKYKALASKHGVTVCSTCLGSHNNGGLATWWRPVEETRREVRFGIDFTRALGAKTMLLPFFFANEPKGLRHRKEVAERLRPVCEYAEKAGVTIAYEGVTPAEQMLEMIDIVNSTAFGVYYDVANATWCDLNPIAEVKLLRKHVRQIHIKDAKTFTGDVHPGQGRVTWPAYRDALRSIGYESWMVLETPSGEPAVVAKDVAFVEELFA